MRKIDKLWPRLNYLVPEPQCSTWDNDYDSIDWKDTRLKPTIEELLAISDASLPKSKTQQDWKEDYVKAKNIDERVKVVASLLGLE